MSSCYFIEDPPTEDYTTTPVAGCIVSCMNFAIAVLVTCYYFGNLQKSERYRQVLGPDNEADEVVL